MSEDLIQAPADRDADAVRSPEEERTLGQVAYDAWLSVMADKGVMECWEAAATAVRDKVRRETIEECAKEADLMASMENYPENIDSVKAVAAAIRDLSPPCVPDRRD